MTRQLSAKQIGELDARDFLGEDTWKRWKLDLDEALSYRKTIKGKPTEEQLEVLKMNADFIEYYGSVLFHSASLAKHNRCVCNRCARARQNK
jgi:hypothetical protein